MQNIVLVGMPGAGKSTIGVLLAKTLGMAFVDTDLLIQEKEKRLLQQIIDSDGVERFLDIEGKVVQSLDLENHIIATGGSVICNVGAVKHLKAIGRIVYLKLTFAEIEDRIKNITTRGIAMHREQNLFDIYQERTPLYEKYADVVIECTGRKMEEVVYELKAKLDMQS